MWWEHLKEISAVAVPVIVSLVTGGGGVWAYLSARQKAHSSSPASITSSQADLVAVLTEQTRLILADSAKDRRDLKRRVDRQGVQLASLAAQILECNTKHADCIAETFALRSEVDKMIRDSRVATYPRGGANVAD